jgi:hypothetical protein
MIHFSLLSLHNLYSYVQTKITGKGRLCIIFIFAQDCSVCSSWSGCEVFIPNSRRDTLMRLINSSYKTSVAIRATVCYKSDPSTLYLSDDYSCEDQHNVSTNTEVYLCLQHTFLFLAT